MLFFSLITLYKIFFYHLTISAEEYHSSTLELVHVLLRHGNRTVTQSYPNDPYANYTYFPFGDGQLTNKGKLQEYQIGKALRKKYDSFLGRLYIPGVLDAVSTEKARTKMSLDLVLAGLYPPSKTYLDWNEELNWQPIPYSIVTQATNELLSAPHAFCPNYIKELMNAPVDKELFEPYKELLEYVNLHSGLNASSIVDIRELYNTLFAQRDFGLTLPSWTKAIFPNILTKAVGVSYLYLTRTPTLRRLSGGFLLKKIVEDSKAKINGTLHTKNRKLFLYSAHDMNIASLLAALNVLDPNPPPYGAYVKIELHKINDVHGFKVFYENYTTSEPLLLTIPGCNSFCPSDKFINLFRDVINIEGDNPCQYNHKQGDL